MILERIETVKMGLVLRTFEESDSIGMTDRARTEYVHLRRIRHAHPTFLSL
jgi:hypothetical protein